MIYFLHTSLFNPKLKGRRYDSYLPQGYLHITERSKLSWNFNSPISHSKLLPLTSIFAYRLKYKPKPTDSNII